MIDNLFILFIAAAAALIFYFIFRGKKVTLGDELVAYIKEKLRENGYQDIDIQDLEIKLEDQRNIIGFIFVSIYRYDGKFVEFKTDEFLPYEIWFIRCDDLVERFLEITGDSNA